MEPHTESSRYKSGKTVPGTYINLHYRDNIMITNHEIPLGRSLLRCVSTLLLAFLAGISLFPISQNLMADDLHLKNGKKMVGVVTRDGDQYRVEFPTAVMTVSASKVEKVVRKPVPWEIFKKKLRKLKDKKKVTANDHYQLARWADEHNLTVHHQQQLQKTLDLDPDHKKARKELGFVQFQDRWMSPEKMMRRRGFMKYNGQWLPKETVQSLIEKERRQERKRRIKQVLHSYIRNMARSPSRSRRNRIYQDMVDYGKRNGLEGIENKAASIKSHYNRVWKKILVQQAYTVQNLNVGRANVSRVRTVQVSNLGFQVQLPQVSLNKYSGGVKVPAK